MISIEYKKGLPLGYESFLIERYDSFISTCRYVEVYYPSYDMGHLLVYRDGSLIELLLLGNKGDTTACFNALVKLPQDIMEKCLAKIFEIFPNTSRVKIDASYAHYELKKSVLFYKSDDHILQLPSSLDTYSAALGSKTRKHLKARLAKLIDEFSTINFVTRFGADIEEVIVDKIIQLNCDRMKHKGKVHGIDNSYKNNIYKYSQHYGCVVYLELNGEIVAGCIGSIINKSLFLHVIAHDNNYSKYNVGEVCVFHLIKTSIEKRLETLHFLWGVSELKRRFLAKPEILYSYFVYRNYSLAYLNEKMKVKFVEMLLSLKDKKISNLVRNAIQDYRKGRLKLYIG
jgi:hypothetical protein